MNKANQEIRDNGRTVTYDNGIVTFQPNGVSHSDYKAGLQGMPQNPSQMPDYVQNLFKKP